MVRYSFEKKNKFECKILYLDLRKLKNSENLNLNKQIMKGVKWVVLLTQ